MAHSYQNANGENIYFMKMIKRRGERILNTRIYLSAIGEARNITPLNISEDTYVLLYCTQSRVISQSM